MDTPIMAFKKPSLYNGHPLDIIFKERKFILTIIPRVYYFKGLLALESRVLWARSEIDGSA